VDGREGMVKVVEDKMSLCRCMWLPVMGPKLPRRGRWSDETQSMTCSSGALTLSWPECPSSFSKGPAFEAVAGMFQKTERSPFRNRLVLDGEKRIAGGDVRRSEYTRVC
jgi:hypothetical protein